MLSWHFRAHFSDHISQHTVITIISDFSCTVGASVYTVTGCNYLPSCKLRLRFCSLVISFFCESTSSLSILTVALSFSLSSVYFWKTKSGCRFFLFFKREEIVKVSFGYFSNNKFYSLSLPLYYSMNV